MATLSEKLEIRNQLGSETSLLGPRQRKSYEVEGLKRALQRIQQSLCQWSAHHQLAAGFGLVALFWREQTRPLDSIIALFDPASLAGRCADVVSVSSLILSFYLAEIA